MTEKDTKESLNDLRAELDKRKKKLNEVLNELRIHQKDINRLRTDRDKGNDKCKELSASAKQMREKRDALNKSISDLKEERKKINKKIKSMSGHIKDNKEKRDELNRSARGTDSSLVSRFEKDIESLLYKDIPLEKEITLYNSVFKLVERVEAAKEATEFHKKVVDTYDKLKDLDDRADKISNDIRTLADESEKFHLQAVELYATVDETRKVADDSHEKLLEKYKLISPLRDNLTEIKKQVDEVQEKMAPYLEEMDHFRALKESEKKAKLAEEAKEKLKTNKRISFDDLRAIMDGSPEEKTDVEPEVKKTKKKAEKKKELSEPADQKEISEPVSPKELSEPAKSVEIAAPEPIEEIEAPKEE